ncbi:MAG: Crp/Fnr family transcriptional regulator [Nitrospirae bacterium]|nr:Crp/Fnr family transcriptional regulator [Nitrospirota bacterium]
MTQEHTKFWYLKNIDIFSHLRDEDIRMIDQYSLMREIKKGEILFLQGSSDKNFYILKKGAVKITKLTPQGNEIILDIFSGGTVFGEIAVMTHESRDESAVVVEDGLICIMKKEDLERLIRMVPGLAIKINKMIGLKLWKIENKLIELLYRTVEQRLAKTFLNLLDDFGIPHDRGYLLKVKLTHKDYADLIASTRETVTATLNKFKKEEIIDFEGKYVLLRSLDKIKALAE